LNIEACRIATDEAIAPFGSPRKSRGGVMNRTGEPREQFEQHPAGRWPANIALDEEAARALDAMSGESKSTGGIGSPFTSPYGIYGKYADAIRANSGGLGDSGGASRFFYTAKASRSEREHGLEGAGKQAGGSTAKGFTEDVARGLDRNRPVANHHPTVKPLDLMRWLVRLVTREGDLVLDPFTGSGTTGVAAIMEGRNFAGIEMNADYLTIAQRRIQNAPLSLFGGAA
jgi:site-specific DNA-methyltransferase (adenine-specific)